MLPQSGGVKDLVAVEDIKEKVLYWLSLDRRVRALAERLLDRFADTVGDLPASRAPPLGDGRPVPSFTRSGAEGFGRVRGQCLYGAPGRRYCG